MISTTHSELSRPLRGPCDEILPVPWRCTYLHNLPDIHVPKMLPKPFHIPCSMLIQKISYPVVPTIPFRSDRSEIVTTRNPSISPGFYHCTVANAPNNALFHQIKSMNNTLPNRRTVGRENSVKQISPRVVFGLQ
ncbi:hypothetical protein VPH35_047502 [Triticum aestivum]